MIAGSLRANSGKQVLRSSLLTWCLRIGLGRSPGRGWFRHQEVETGLSPARHGPKDRDSRGRDLDSG